MDFDAAVAAVDGQLVVADEADELGVVDTVRRDELALGVVKLTVAVSQDDGDMVAMKDGFVDVHRGKRDAGLAGASQQPLRTTAIMFFLSSLVGFSICVREEYDRMRQHVTQAEAHASCSRLHQFLPKLIKSI